MTPSMEVIKVNVANIIAASMAIYDTAEVDTSAEGGQLGREDDVLSGSNVWEQGW